MGGNGYWTRRGKTDDDGASYGREEKEKGKQALVVGVVVVVIVVHTLVRKMGSRKLRFNFFSLGWAGLLE